MWFTFGGLNEKNMFGLNKEVKNEPQYAEAIAMVHNEFETAGEKLYQEALGIINSTKLLNEEKVIRLQKLGFTATKEVVDAQKTLNERKLSEEMVETIKYYRDRYPLNKFITEDQIKEICKKYGLIYGKVSSYTGFVPQSSLDKMESCVIKDEDVPWTAVYMGIYSRSDRAMSRNDIAEWKKEHDDIDANADFISFSSSSQDIERSREFLIAAPQKDFNISDKQKVNDFKIVNKPIPDPVVFAPVIGGYLIVTAWGDEASDPLVQNEIVN